MNDYIRNAFKSLEDLKVVIEPVHNPLKEDVVEEVPVEELTVKELFEKESSYIVTHEFEDDGLSYSLFLEALNEDGDSCDILFEEFDSANIQSALVEVLDSEHEFLGSLTGEDITLETSISEVLSKAKGLISGEEAAEEPVEVSSDEHTAEDHDEEANERVFINGDPDELPPAELDAEVEVKEESLNESKTFNLQDDKEVDEAEREMKKKSKDAIEQIVDIAAESEGELKKSYIGSTILQCPTCLTMIYKNPDQVIPSDDDPEIFNVEEACPHCGAKDGFTRIGTVASLDVDPFAEPEPPMPEPEPMASDTEEEPTEDDLAAIEAGNEHVGDALSGEEGVDSEGHVKEEVEFDVVEEAVEPEEGCEDGECEEESSEEEKKEEKSEEEPLNEEAECEIKLTVEEKNMLDKLTHKNKMDSWFWIDDETDTIKDLEDGEKVLDTCEAILDVADGTEDIEQFLEPEEIELFNNLVERCKACKESSSKEVKEECEGEECKEECKGEECHEEHVCEKCGKNPCECLKEKKTGEVKLESFDEFKFDKLVTRYLKETYSNVKSYKTVTAGLIDSANRAIMEGIITFKSGKEKPTKFVFEAKEITNKNKLKLVGINEMFSKGKAFTLLGTVDNNKLLSESLAYRYESEGKKIRGKAESFRKR